MNHICFRVLAFVCVVSLTLSAALPVWGATDAPIVGEHVVQKGETLYCIGRGYGVVPSAIAEANGLSAFAFLSVGQVLKIPAVQWSPIPPGLVCVGQFESPFTGGAGVTLTTTPSPPTATPGCSATSGQTYTVKRGDTLFRIALHFGVSQAVIIAANGITNPNRINVGQVLVIPGGPPPAAAVQIACVHFDGVVFRAESDEYAVITNHGGAAVNLAGWRLNAGDAGQDFVFPSFELQPGQSCRVYTNEVHTETCGFTFGRGSAIWNNAGDCGYLYQANGTLVSKYCY
jgi:LysM repeat protein